MRIGTGFDAHRFTEGRPLIIGGVKLDYPLGLLGHSDADVLLHAIVDALLGAAALGDIGTRFPDTDPQYEGISSIELLKKTRAILSEAGLKVANIDATVIAQEPRLEPHIKDMVENISRALEIDAAAVSVKATTSEGMGFVGRKEGLAAMAVALVVEKQAAL